MYFDIECFFMCGEDDTVKAEGVDIFIADASERQYRILIFYHVVISATV